MGLRAIVGAAALAAVLNITPGLAATVVIAVPNWPSAEVSANIIGQLLDREVGVTPRLRHMNTSQILDAIDRGEVDVHPEIWLPNLEAAVAEYAGARRTLTLSQRATDAGQYMCTTRATQDATGLTHIADLTRPDIAARFDTDDDGLGEVWIGANGWSSTPVERVRAHSYGYHETMTLLEMPENLAMAAIDAAVVTGQPIVFYCYSPHFVFQLHDIVRLAEPEHDPERWQVVLPTDDPAWQERSVAAMAWKPSSFRIGYASYLDADLPMVSQFLRNVTFTTEEAEAMSYAIDVEQRAPADVAAEWIDENSARWKEWTK